MLEKIIDPLKLSDESAERDRIQIDEETKELAISMERHRAVIHKKVPSIFKEKGIPLSEKITEMLMEPDSMQRGRIGSGYTNVYRELATYINQPTKNPLTLLSEYEVNEITDYDFSLGRDEKIKKLQIRERLESISKLLTHPSHVVLIGMIRDIFLGSEKDLPTIKPLTDLKGITKAGTCTTAERYYFEWSTIKDLWYFTGGYDEAMHIITDVDGKPLMIEKGSGNTSCLSLVPLKIGTVEVPAGSMIQAIPKDDTKTEKLELKSFSGKSKIGDYEGFNFLRISTLALPSEYREESFGNHYFQQKKDEFVNYDWLEMHHYLELVEDALK